MFKKNFSLMILAVALSFNCPLKAMEDPQRNKQLEDESSGSSGISYSISTRAALYIELLNDDEIDLSNLEQLREKLSGWITESELESCCIMLAKIKSHCAFVEQFKEYAFFGITENNLRQYRQFLCILFDAGMDLNLVFSATANYFQETTTNSKVFKKFDRTERFLGITFNEINVLLLILIKHRNAEEDEVQYNRLKSLVLSKIIPCIFEANLVDLYLLLVESNLWPSLDTILTNDNLNLLMLLVRYCEDVRLFKRIINKEKAGSYDWNYIFSASCDAGLTVLHYAAGWASKDIIEILLELMEENGLDLDRFVYMQNNAGITPFTLACHRHEDANELFIYYTTGLRKIINKHSVYSLKFLTASRYLKALKNGELDLSTSSELPKELQFYYATLDSINKHCDLVEQLKNSCTFLEITPENLNDYRKLLHVILDKENIDLNLILSVFDRYLKEIIDNPEQFIQAHTENGNFHGLTLMNINALLTILIKHIFAKQDSNLEKFTVSQFEMSSLGRAITYAFREDLDDLYLLLEKGDLFPSLNCIMNARHNSFFAYLVYYCKNMNMFNEIINKEIDKEYNWKELFGMSDNFTTILNYAVYSGSKMKVEAILNLIRDKKLDLDDFINIQDQDGRSPLMIANGLGYSEISELLISNGAQ